MRVNLSAAEVAVIRNALATRHDDLRDLIAEWSEDAAQADPDNFQRAEEEMDLVIALGARLPQS